MAKKITNNSAGLRGVTMKDGSTVWIEAGETKTVDGEIAVVGDMGDPLDHDGDGTKGGTAPAKT